MRVCSNEKRIADDYSKTRLGIGSQLQGTQLSEGNISQHTVRAHRNPDRHNDYKQQRKTVVGVTMSYQA